MPKINIYVPEDLLEELRQHDDLALSTIAQDAFRAALRTHSNAAWVARAHARRPRTSRRIDSAALLDEVRDEFGA